MSADLPSAVTAKLRYDNKIRRITIAKQDPVHPSPLPLSWAEFEASIRLQCAIPLSSRIIVNYYDQDGDAIQIDSDRELSELAKSVHEGTLPTLKFEVNTEENISADENDFVMIPTPPGSDTDSVSDYQDLAASDQLLISEVAVDENKVPVDATEVLNNEATDPIAGTDDDISSSEILNHVVESYREESIAGVQVSLEPLVASAAESEEASEVQASPPSSDGASAPATAEDSFESYLNEVQPMIDNLLNKLESRPEYIPQLLEHFSTSLGSRNWGLTIEVPGGAAASTRTAPIQPVAAEVPAASSEVPPASSEPQVQWTGVRCDACGAAAFSGTRHKCLQCADYDLCGACFRNFETRVQHPGDHSFETLTSPTEVWRGVTCDGCNRVGFPGLRYKCLDCYDYDLCGKCIVDPTHRSHRRNHTFDCMDPQLRGHRNFGLGSFPSVHRDFRGRQRPHSHVFISRPPPVPRPRMWDRSSTADVPSVLSVEPTAPVDVPPKAGSENVETATGASPPTMPGGFPSVSTTKTDLRESKWVCGEAGCSKSYFGRSGLRYHREHVHGLPGPVPASSIPPALSQPTSDSDSYAIAARRAVAQDAPAAPNVRFGSAEVIPRLLVEDIETGIIPHQSDDPMDDPQAKLLMMGFENTELNADLLRFFDGDLERVISKLMRMDSGNKEDEEEEDDDLFWTSA